MNTVIVTVNEHGVARLEFNRPKALNALNDEMMSEVKDALAELGKREDVKALIITGRGRAFCAGADLKSMPLDKVLAGEITMGNALADSMTENFNPLVELIYHFPRPVITAVNGLAVGGGAGIALCADVILAAEDALLKIVQPSTMGIVGDLGANWMLPRLAGRSRAIGMCLLGDGFTGRQLKEWGIVWDCVGNSTLMEKADEIAVRLSKVPAKAVVSTRNLIDKAADTGFGDTLEQEAELQRELANSPEFLAAVKKFLGVK